MKKLVAAMQELLESRPFHRITTNHIATCANVNIGSLYQYFASREAIAYALYEQAAAHAAGKINRSVMVHLERDIHASMPKMIGRLVEVYAQNPTVLLRLPGELGELRIWDASSSVNDAVVSIGRIYIEQRRPDLTLIRREAAYAYLSLSTIASIREYLISPTYGLTRSAFVRELSRSIVAYIEAL